MTPGEVTQLLAQIHAADPGAEERLAQLVYDELRKVAAGQMRRERTDHKLSPTALVNEAWARLGVALPGHEIRSRHQFFAAAATAMRRILVEHARARHAEKRGGAAPPVRVDAMDDFAAPGDEQLIAIDDALAALAVEHPRAARVVELRFFGGFTHQEIAQLLKLERRTVDRDWALARAWLFGQLRRTGGQA